jgi:hypothetical protein
MAKLLREVNYPQDGPISVPETLRDQLRAKLPGKAKKAAGSSKAAAIELHCTECMGGSAKEAKACATTDCFLWKHGFGRKL